MSAKKTDVSWCYVTIAKNFRIQIDKEDLDRVSKIKWVFQLTRNNMPVFLFYEVKGRSRRKHRLARFILNFPAGLDVILRDPTRPFDYRKRNLLACYKQKRIWQLPKSKKKRTSIYKGVSKTKKGLWRAGIEFNEKCYNLGDWPTEEEAARAYNEASRKFYGEIGYQNPLPHTGSKRNGLK
jgi:hypothetical protein